MTRRRGGRAWKLIGLAGLTGVAATGVLLARDERRRRAYTPDEIRGRLQERHLQATAVTEPVATTSPAGRRTGHRPDPVKIAKYETDAWIGYYLHEWPRVLRGALGMVREGFGTSPAQTVRGAWWVLRANQVWAPYPVNDPDAARRFMTRFYRIAAAAQGWDLDAREAARLEVAWWAAHRDVQRGEPGQGHERLVAALADLYAYVYGVPVEQAREVALHRALAMRVSDDWVADGCRPDDPRLAEEEAELVLSYTALRDLLAGVTPPPR